MLTSLSKENKILTKVVFGRTSFFLEKKKKILLHKVSPLYKKYILVKRDQMKGFPEIVNEPKNQITVTLSG